MYSFQTKWHGSIRGEAAYFDNQPIWRLLNKNGKQ